MEVIISVPRAYMTSPNEKALETDYDDDFSVHYFTLIIQSIIILGLIRKTEVKMKTLLARPKTKSYYIASRGKVFIFTG